MSRGRLRPLAELGPGEARGLEGVVFDLDDTVLDHGALGEAAYVSLFRLREAGLRLYACTGRPAGWGEVIARQWPVDAVVAENGAFAFATDPTAKGPRRIAAIGDDGEADLASEIDAARARRAPLAELAAELCARFPATALADDNHARFTDVTLDIGEHRRVSPDDVAAIRAIAAGRGVRTFASAVHLHLTRAADDKASGALRVLGRLRGVEPVRARRSHAFVGDSGNDAAAFAAFSTTFGVANLRRHLARLTVPPRYLAEREGGAGFAEIAARLVALRGASRVA